MMNGRSSFRSDNYINSINFNTEHFDENEYDLSSNILPQINDVSMVNGQYTLLQQKDKLTFNKNRETFLNNIEALEIGNGEMGQFPRNYSPQMNDNIIDPNYIPIHENFHNNRYHQYPIHYPQYIPEQINIYDQLIENENIIYMFLIVILVIITLFQKNQIENLKYLLMMGNNPYSHIKSEKGLI